MDDKPEIKYRIGMRMSIFLLCLAAVADLITLIPLAGDIVGWVFWGLAAIYFWKAGLGLVNWRRFVPSVISAVAELFPVVQEFPTILAAMFAILILARIEDKTGVSVLPKSGKGKVTPLNEAGIRRAPPRIPLNQGSVRPPNGGLVT